MRHSTTKPTINPGQDLFAARAAQSGAYRSGEALRGHINTAHQGKIDLTCAACREITKRSLLARSEHASTI